MYWFWVHFYLLKLESTCYSSLKVSNAFQSLEAHVSKTTNDIDLKVSACSLNTLMYPLTKFEQNLRGSFGDLGCIDMAWSYSRWYCLLTRHLPTQVNNRNTRAKYEICLQLTIKIAEQYWRCSDVFIVNCEHISHLSLVCLVDFGQVTDYWVRLVMSFTGKWKIKWCYLHIKRDNISFILIDFKIWNKAIQDYFSKSEVKDFLPWPTMVTEVSLSGWRLDGVIFLEWAFMPAGMSANFLNVHKWRGSLYMHCNLDFLGWLVGYVCLYVTWVQNWCGFHGYCGLCWSQNILRG